MIGIDILKIDEFRRRANRSEFVNRVFSLNEKKYAEKYRDAVLHLAGMFAAKEAVRKALRCRIDFDEVEIFHEFDGTPYALVGKERKRVELSISYGGDVVVAVAIASLP